MTHYAKSSIPVRIFGGVQSVQLCAELGLISVLTWARQQTPKRRESKSTGVTAHPLYLKKEN